jgi:hypothetical protein
MSERSQALLHFPSRRFWIVFELATIWELADSGTLEIDVITGESFFDDGF